MPQTSGGKEEKPPSGIEAVPEKILIRFIDAGLEPGRAYQYYVQVRLKNPNFGKDKAKEVAFAAMAEKTHLESPWVLTPPVVMPQDYSVYFVNQSPLATKVKGRGKATIDTAPLIPADKIPVQIHQLTPNSQRDPTQGNDHEVGDWVVAERLFLGRGDIIARQGLEVEMPYWDPLANAFITGTKKKVGTGKAARYVDQKSIPVDFGDETSPVLADFRGGKIDEGNIEVLVLMGDGRMVIRNSYEDADPESLLGQERAQRYEAWRSRLESFRQAPTNGPAAPTGPKVPNING